MKRKLRGYTVVLEQDGNAGFVAHIPKLPGCHTQGETESEAMKNIAEALELYLERKGWHMLAMESMKRIWDNPKDEEMAKRYEKRLKKGKLRPNNARNLRKRT